jgi:hypothetical protein
MNKVIVVIGAGSIGQAIARRVSTGKKVLLADLRQENAEKAALVMRDAGFDVTTAAVDVAKRQTVRTLVEQATALGEVTGLIHAAGVSPTQAPPATILAVDLHGTAVVLEEFGNIIARDGSGVVIASQSGHRLAALTVEQNKALALTPADELLALPFLQPDQVKDSSTPTSSPSAATLCGSWPRRSAGASAARGSTPSARESFSPRWRATSSAGRAERATAG